jgi:arylsulfatase A-like enzyme
MVQHTDKIVGDLLTRLDEAGRRRRTIIIFTSDGGAPPQVVGRADGRDVPGGRSALTERGVCVPLIISVPLNTRGSEFIRHGTETDCLADVTDLAPTLCDLALLQRPQDAHFDGRSFAPLIVGSSSRRRATGSWRCREA